MQSTTIGSRITSFIPLSSRSASLGGAAGCRDGGSGCGAAPGRSRRAPRRGWRPRARWRPSSSQAASAMSAAGSSVPGPEDERREPPLLADLADVHADGVAEQHQHQAERRDDLERGRVERELDQAEPGRGRAAAPTSRKIATCGQAGPLDRARQERRDDDDDRRSAPGAAVKLSWVMADRVSTRAMPTSEPFATALLLAIAGTPDGGERAVQPGVAAGSACRSRSCSSCIGMLAGSEGIGGIAFEDYGFAFRLGSLALALILFDGGLNTPLAALRRTWAPAGAARHGRRGAHRGADRDAGAPLGSRLAAGAGARRRRVVHRRGVGVRGAPRQRAPAQAAGGHHARARVGPQRSRRGHPHHRAHRQPAPPGRDRCGPRRMRSRSLLQLVVGAALGVGDRAGRARCCSGGFRCRPADSTRRSRWRFALLAYRGHDAAPRQRVPRGVPGRHGARATGPCPTTPACSGCTTRWPGWRRSGCSSSSACWCSRAGCSRWRAPGSAWRCCSRSWRGRWSWRSAWRRSAIPRREIALHRLGRPPRRGADRAGDLPGAGRRAGRGPDLPHGVLHRGGERAGAGRRPWRG